MFESRSLRRNRRCEFCVALPYTCWVSSRWAEARRCFKPETPRNRTRLARDGELGLVSDEAIEDENCPLAQFARPPPPEKPPGKKKFFLSRPFLLTGQRQAML